MIALMILWRRYRTARGWGKPWLWSLRYATFRRVGLPPQKASPRV
jgi:hypothetical protein